MDKEIPTGKKRKRCVNCKKLTWSSWYLSYPKGEDYIEGIHCYDCYDLFDKGLLQEEIKTISDLRKELAIKTAPGHSLIELYKRSK